MSFSLEKFYQNNNERSLKEGVNIKEEVYSFRDQTHFGEQSKSKDFIKVQKDRVKSAKGQSLAKSKMPRLISGVSSRTQIDALGNKKFILEITKTQKGSREESGPTA